MFRSAIHRRHLLNRAFIFVKPHAVVPKICEEIPRLLLRHDVHVDSSGHVESAPLRDGHLIDRHYSSISHAARLPPETLAEMLSNSQAFVEAFGQSSAQFHAAGRLLNAQMALDTLRVEAEEMKTRFNALCFKAMPGIYVAELDGYIVVNGFYARLREKFTAPGAEVAWFIAEFRAKDLPWKRFREEVIGATDPSLATKGSLRAELLERGVKELGLKKPLDKQDNAVHASAGPLESLAELRTWLDRDISMEPLGKVLIEAIGEDRAQALLENPTLKLSDGRTGRAFDLFEDADAQHVFEVLRDLPEGCVE
eukprot:TRINITY_DN31246_c0_g1_i1.p1 TRINITY_DN31246_c0_g1~~TRINITY_DN31246_c0_g1_i1.p1  ORF type:complete len:320 (+),score=46.74 TRINITY_DN31246_c0_g1_i1:32-961(+)